MRDTTVGLVKTALAAAVIIPLDVSIGKAIEYGTVDLLGSRTFGIERLDAWRARKRPPDRSGGPSLP